MTALLLPGLEAANPLGYFAALGLLRILDDHARAGGEAPPRLGFVDDGGLVAQLDTGLSLDQIIPIVLADARAQADNAALQFAYTKAGDRVLASAETAIQDLKPTLELAHALLTEVVGAPRRVSDQAAAWFTEVVTDGAGTSAKPTAFHFTAGQQTFLDMVEKLRVGLNDGHLREALAGPWLNKSELPSLSWDASAARLYALRATNPSGEKRGSVPGANWLAVIGLVFFPVAARHGRLDTLGVSGSWKDSTFTWPVWGPPADARTVASLLRLRIDRWTAAQRAVAGVTEVFRSRILRSDQGGYGSFTPAKPLPPA